MDRDRIAVGGSGSNSNATGPELIRLGHRSLRNTLVYTHLIDFESDEYSCRVGKTVGEVTMLIEDGFDYVTEIEGAKLFRKRR